MAEEPVGLKITEKFFGLLIILIGAIVFYVTYTNIESLVYPAIFLILGAALIVLGVLMVLARAE